MRPSPFQILLRSALLLAAGAALCVGLLHVARAYDIFADGVSGGRLRWDTSAFTTDNAFVVLPEGGFAADGADHALPNQDTQGLLFRVDNSASTAVDCDEKGIYESSGAEPFESVYRAMGRWSAQAADARVNLQYVCSVNFDVRATDAIADGPAMDVFDAAGEAFILNGFNEIIFDDTPDLAILDNIVAMDPAVVVSIGFPLDAGGQLLGPGGSGPITEATVFFNVGMNAPPSNLEAAATHEIGHVLGLAHAAGLSARAVGMNNAERDRRDMQRLAHVAVMNPFMFDEKSADLKTDDIAGLTILYPAADMPKNFGAISGRVLDREGKPRRGATVIAFDEDDHEIAVVIGSNPLLSPDQYIIDNVPPGLYRVALVTDADGVADTYYDSAESEVLAARVKVSAQMETTGVDFIERTNPISWR